MSPFLEAFLKEKPQPLFAGTLEAELREAVARWFDHHKNGMQDQTAILSALISLIAEQVAANPEIETQRTIMRQVLASTLACINAANRAHGRLAPDDESAAGCGAMGRRPVRGRRRRLIRSRIN
jgi:uncharacterized protein